MGCTRGSHRNRMRLLVLLLTVLLFVEEGFSIKCYECGGFPTNRATNPLCEGEDDFGRDTGHSCQTDKGYSVCIKIEDPAGQKSMRSCKWDVQLAKWVTMLLSWARMNASSGQQASITRNVSLSVGWSMKKKN